MIQVSNDIDNTEEVITLENLDKLDDDLCKLNPKKKETLLSITTVSSEEEPIKLKRVSFNMQIDIVCIDSLKRYNKQNSFTEDFNGGITEEDKCFCTII